MNEYILQEGVSDNPNGVREPRVFLDDRLHKGCAPLATYHAKSWIEARYQVVGF